jgi:hypothetical protein
MNNYLILICVFLILILSKCSNSPTEVKYQSTSCSLPDSLFPLKNIKNSLVYEHIYCDTNNICYLDSSKKIKLPMLDSAQKKQFLDSIPPLSSDWIMMDWQVHSISRQNKIWSFTPIIISAGGTDYSALILILLDSSCHPVSKFILSGGECGDAPSQCDVKHSFINGKKINSYVRKIVNFLDSDNAIVDSINYETKILSTGKFETRQIDSTRYKTRIIEED